MNETNVAQPPMASREEWRTARVALLAREKALTRQKDSVNAERRRLPMVRIDKPYRFDSNEGQRSLLDLFAGRRQLIVYHFMFDPAWEKGCSGCTGLVDALGDLSLLAERDTSFVLVSRAPLAKLDGYRQQRGWTWPWVSSNASDFNYDFHVTLDESVAPLEYNYRRGSELGERGEGTASYTGEAHGMSVFFRVGDQVFHTYSTYARGCESLTDSYSLLDLTPYGRQESFEESPAGWPQKPTYG